MKGFDQRAGCIELTDRCGMYPNAVLNGVRNETKTFCPALKIAAIPKSAKGKIQQHKRCADHEKQRVKIAHSVDTGFLLGKPIIEKSSFSFTGNRNLYSYLIGGYLANAG